ncbi:hypothetical protein AT261_10310 [Bacillus cereus]|uniref:GTP pyrophosphokinase n=1 Tax=unclassified Bacillus (in: firmicutes) TaxID=185979 RepID=UPI00077AD914|nr:hypothetical protein AT261_10310 [Bacillus cereus]
MEPSIKEDVSLVNMYENMIPKYNKLGINLTQAIELLLEEHSIQYLKVYYRIKESDSFMGKTDRKRYIDPFNEVEDICGIRIICYYKSDIDKICNVINEEFDVLESQDKEELLKPDQFGYRSHHFIVKIKEEWLCTPNYKGLADLKAEIQIRTNLMHTWAEIEHELGYKKEEDIPSEFRRKFSRISAKLEEADEQFEDLKSDISVYRDSRANSPVILDEDLNADNLQAFLDKYFSDRKIYKDGASDLVSELKRLDINLPKLLDLHEKCKDLLLDLEEAERELFDDDELKWAQIGALRSILMLTVDNYMEGSPYPKELKDLINEFKKKLNH